MQQLIVAFWELFFQWCLLVSNTPRIFAYENNNKSYFDQQLFFWIFFAFKRRKVLNLIRYFSNIYYHFLYSHISGITLLAMPSDVYKHGSTISVMNIGIILVCIFTAYVSIPVFYELQLTSTYEYLKMRFNSKIRTMASLLYIINIILILPVVIYAPSLAFTQGNVSNRTAYYTRQKCYHFSFTG